jgi:hypothetical protein
VLQQFSDCGFLRDDVMITLENPLMPKGHEGLVLILNVSTSSPLFCLTRPDGWMFVSNGFTGSDER